ncbi:hypothetical protein B0T17DRAFT_520280 [Bombardia bombarda]|uniref:Uncharacterized protein n=1 Tax=Bombardia bombarda TaxID=252184 RepID=A0AA39XPU4_9PEZI|nr:hypothetical protein B0T17DRAFT_520280 [Bombardia bombarda]
MTPKLPFHFALHERCRHTHFQFSIPHTPHTTLHVRRHHPDHQARNCLKTVELLGKKQHGTSTKRLDSIKESQKTGVEMVISGREVSTKEIKEARV